MHKHERKTQLFEIITGILEINNNLLYIYHRFIVFFQCNKTSIHELSVCGYLD